MRDFAALYLRLDETTRTSSKLAALRDYFEKADPADAAWAVHFLTGRRLKKLLPVARLRDWGAEAAGIPTWLFEESYHAVGDLAETLALLMPDPSETWDIPLNRMVEEILGTFPDLEESEKKAHLFAAWRGFDRDTRLAFNKLLTGSFRVGVAHGLVVRALAENAGVPPAVVAGRLMGNWSPTAAFFRNLVGSTADAEEDCSRPYPFLLAHPLDTDTGALGDPAAWQVEWKWDGIRAQLIRRGGQVFIWSRGEELLNGSFPDLVESSARIPDGTVLDGEILVWKNNIPLGFAELQKRVGRKNPGRRILEQSPAVFLAFDLLEIDGSDARSQVLQERRRMLEGLMDRFEPGNRMRISPLVGGNSWGDFEKLRNESRTQGVEGLMVKRLDSVYASGRPRGDWWKWKVEPLSVDAVMLYAQLGHGRRASLYTDYTFGVWLGDELVPFARAYSGLTDEEIREVDRWVRSHTLERFGPVRRVRPELVFEIGFEGIQRSKRHRAGLAVRFPRILRIRKDKKAAEADTVERMQGFMEGRVSPEPEYLLFRDD